MSTGQRPRGPKVKYPGVNKPEFAESIISVQSLAERVKQSSLGQRGSNNQVLAERVEQQGVLTVRVEQ